MRSRKNPIDPSLSQNKEKSIQKQITVFSGCCVKDNSVLMVQRFEPECPEAHLKWEFPGGKVDFGETPQEALIREFREEAGVLVKPIQLLPFIQTSYWTYAWGIQQTLCFCFFCRFQKDVKLSKKDHHVSEISWIPISKVKKLSTLPGTEAILKMIGRFKKIGDGDHSIPS